MLIDTHAHMDDAALYKDLDGVLERAKEAGVQTIVNIGFDWKSSLMSLRLSEKYPQVYATVGLHPHNASSWNTALEEKLLDLAKEDKVVAIGEMGLDYYCNLSPKEAQQKAFRSQIALAKEVGKPIVIHDRDAHGDCLSIVKEEKAGVNGGIFHCYSGSWEMAKECMRLGFYISLAGPVTYQNAKKLWEVAQNMPLDKLLIETDAPYLSPHPYRGKTNEPARVKLVAERIAELKGLPFEEIAAATTENARQIYRLPSTP